MNFAYIVVINQNTIQPANEHALIILELYFNILFSMECFIMIQQQEQFIC